MTEALYKNVDGKRVKMTKAEARAFEASRAPQPPSVDQIKAECGRRIEALYPVWKQINMMRDPNAFAFEFQWIDRMRGVSDALEGMDPRPVDYRDDRHWPA